jgi:hypothetical protein
VSNCLQDLEEDHEIHVSQPTKYTIRATETGVARLVDLAETACSEGREDVVRPSRAPALRPIYFAGTRAFSSSNQCRTTSN